MEKFITKHTPGPWSINPIGSDDWKLISHAPRANGTGNFATQSAWIVDGSGHILGEVKAYDAPGFVTASCGQFEANAQLIAAAPLLLSALIKAVEDFDHRTDLVTEMHEQGHTWKNWPEIPVWYNEAKAAIAAAGVVVEESKETVE